jgi:hypothetical protein
MHVTAHIDDQGNVVVSDGRLRLSAAAGPDGSVSSATLSPDVDGATLDWTAAMAGLPRLVAVAEAVTGGRRLAGHRQRPPARGCGGGGADRRARTKAATPARRHREAEAAH